MDPVVFAESFNDTFFFAQSKYHSKWLPTNPGPCCFTGFKHDGKPSGETISIGKGLAYIAKPNGDIKVNQAVLVLSDVFGLFNNSKLLSDDFATNGYLVVLPDLLSGDQMDVGDFEAGKTDIPDWISRHGTDAADPIVQSTLDHMRENLGIPKIAAAGYCFDGNSGKIDIGYSAHRSFVSDEELAAIENPFSISAAEVDGIFTREHRYKSEKILNKTGKPYQLKIFSGVKHGFGIRADLSKPHNKYAKEQAFLQALAWFELEL
ncbi:uncharacterized protein N7511_011504 [Penicillium nucicola]|uniref:uncharacterized protein n=1 Tax=Penicillium nucicola TaxID=1850975 RepID=UPI00254509DB|nr:uncharacterized protein N7511_011504 [Penicillium nucicola]KAJ5742485.1 hypothetical protein N7511_011504 [Penicillium nucicola]